MWIEWEDIGCPTEGGTYPAKGRGFDVDVRDDQAEHAQTRWELTGRYPKCQLWGPHPRVKDDRPRYNIRHFEDEA